MQNSIYVLVLTAVMVAFTHTLLGPDHYLPFIVMARAGHWSDRKAYVVTFLCGVGHVLSSVVIGTIGIAFGVALGRLNVIESARGEIAAWALIVFGTIYGVWGLRRAWQGRRHEHSHAHEDGSRHVHDHNHRATHGHLHEPTRRTLTPWVLFTIFVLGPCEPLIPILMFPAARHSLAGLVFVTMAFALVTIATMLALVGFSLRGISLVKTDALERYAHALAGFIIAASGIAIRAFGL